QGLALDVLGAHVDFALEAEQRRRRGRGHAVLPSARLGDEPSLLHPRGEQSLPQHVVDLVRAGVAKILALEIDPCAADVLGGVPGEGARARSARIVAQQRRQLLLNPAIAPCSRIGLLQSHERRHQRLGHETPAIRAEVTARIGKLRAHAALRASAMKRRTFSASFLPGARSTPEFTSTANGWTIAMARATLSGGRPPDRIIGRRPISSHPRVIRHSIGRRVSPSLHRALVSRSTAAATSWYRTARTRSLTLNSGRPSIVVAGGSLIVLITGRS